MSVIVTVFSVRVCVCVCVCVHRRPSIFRKLLFSLCFFHAIIQVSDHHCVHTHRKRNTAHTHTHTHTHTHIPHTHTHTFHTRTHTHTHTRTHRSDASSGHSDGIFRMNSHWEIWKFRFDSCKGSLRGIEMCLTRWACDRWQCIVIIIVSSSSSSHHLIIIVIIASSHHHHRHHRIIASSHHLITIITSSPSSEFVQSPIHCSVTGSLVCSHACCHYNEHTHTHTRTQHLEKHIFFHSPPFFFVGTVFTLTHLLSLKKSSSKPW